VDVSTLELVVLRRLISLAVTGQYYSLLPCGYFNFDGLSFADGARTAILHDERRTTLLPCRVDFAWQTCPSSGGDMFTFTVS
jgi:hypothetical protein